ncbi:MAG: hypothetical protein HKM06_07765 [Spirochaetales bacterium]|nr:hypothetical protein [Spirochaetales bacterium]
MLQAFKNSLLQILVFLFVGASLYSQTVTKKSTETFESFLERTKPPHSQIVDDIVVTQEWSKNNEAIICFDRYDEMVEGEAYPAIVGYLYWRVGKEEYHEIHISTFESDGGAPEIRAVFFDRVYGENELVVICAWPQLMHYDYGGTFYSVYFFRKPEHPATQLSLDKDKRWSALFENQCDCTYRDGHKESAPFVHEAEVRAEITKLTKPHL